MLTRAQHDLAGETSSLNIQLNALANQLKFNFVCTALFLCKNLNFNETVRLLKIQILNLPLFEVLDGRSYGVGFELFYFSVHARRTHCPMVEGA